MSHIKAQEIDAWRKLPDDVKYYKNQMYYENGYEPVSKVAIKRPYSSKNGVKNPKYWTDGKLNRSKINEDLKLYRREKDKRKVWKETGGTGKYTKK